MLLQAPSEQHPSQEVINELVRAVSDSDLFSTPYHVLTEALLPPAQIKEVEELMLNPTRGVVILVFGHSNHLHDFCMTFV